MSNVQTLCINTIRTLSADVVQKANSGHPGAPMGLAPLAHTLWGEGLMSYNSANPDWPNRDRFILSNGHACALLYTMLHLSGYRDFTMDELKNFRQLGSKTPGHPEIEIPGIEVTTGPLGQGFCNGVGFAIAEKNLAANFNKDGFKIVDHFVYVVVGDGCLQEGMTSEAASLAGHLGLGKLIVLYDDNKITIDGSTELSFTEDVNKRFEAYGWHTATVTDGDHDVDSIKSAILQAQRVTDRPSLIKIRTTIGFGSKKQGTEHVHGSPLGEEILEETKQKFGFDPKKKFFIPEEVAGHYNETKNHGQELEAKWNALLDNYKEAHPKLYADFVRRTKSQLPADWKNALPRFSPSDKALATRQHSHNVLKKLAPAIPELIGGSADLAPSNLTLLPDTTDFQKNTPAGRNIRYGVREHSMVAISNGIAAYGSFIPFDATFFNFIGYAMGAVTVGALSHLGVIHIMTHDSIGLGEDGPTHQPVEKILACRSTPVLITIRPADGNEVSAAYISAIENRHRPTVLALSRQAAPNLEGSSIESALKGAYILKESEAGVPQVILVGTGTEVSLCVEAQAKLKSNGIRARVVSMPSWELFEDQSGDYKSSVFTAGIPVISIEAGTTLGWAKYAHDSIGLDTFGASGPAKDVYKKFGITTENLVKRATDLTKNGTCTRSKL
eukprot:TRINITY_DN3147_c0_g1_i2.p1 TRINITY_DN3147_c0_g1~~TRINITY_DN3147_c0_g1_i2.p1  ORF type:complete len:670 (-),score=332.92 TRINITY_DN3147_c0_g1_i2:89-2098(-)